MRVKVFVFLTLVVVVFTSMRVDPSTGMIVDDKGQSRIFHGVNIVYKPPPFHPNLDEWSPEMSLTSEDMVNLKEKFGMNVARLGVMWMGVEPIQGQFNSTYLDIMRGIADDLGNHGIYTIIDMHQDLFSREFCGEGFPEWVVSEIPIDSTCDNSFLGVVTKLFGACKTFPDYHFTYEGKNPDISQCLKHDFVMYYPTPEVSSAFQGLYTSENILQKFSNYWKVVAETFKDSPTVLGYDLLNEPWAGNIWEDSSVIEPGKTDKKYLQPLYQRLNTVIRGIDTEKILFFEPTQFPDTMPVLGGVVSDVGFTETPGGPEYDDKQMLNTHVYCCAAGTNICSSGEPALKYAGECKKFDTKKLKTRVANGKSLGVGTFMTEFGACANNDACIHEINSVTDAADDQLVSWCYWQFKGYGDYTTTGSLTEGFYNPDGSVQDYKVGTLSRTYAQITQGQPTFMRFDYNTTAFGFQYELDPSIESGSTVIYMNNELNYPQGSTINITPPGLESSQEGNFLTLTPSSEITSQTTFNITITPKSELTSGIVKGSKGNCTIGWKANTTTSSGIVTFALSENSALKDTLTFDIEDSWGNQLCSLTTKNGGSCQIPSYSLPGYSVKVTTKEYLVITETVAQFNMGPLNDSDIYFEVSE